MSASTTTHATPGNGAMPPDQDEVLSYLRTCADLIRLSREHGALLAAWGLSGARLARCRELANQLTAAEAMAERLHTVVTGDVRAERAGQ